jgi:hypothetical protein
VSIPKVERECAQLAQYTGHGHRATRQARDSLPACCVIRQICPERARLDVCAQYLVLGHDASLLPNRRTSGIPPDAVFQCGSACVISRWGPTPVLLALSACLSPF